jgi:DNA (cytosine-5)-methyltransferase 1
MESWSDKKLGRSGAVVRMGDAQGERCGEARELSARPKERIANAGTDGRMADADDTGLEGRDGMHQRSIECATGPSGVVEWIDCRDGKRRPIEPGAFPLAYGDTFRVGRLRAYGNAIHAEAAEAFIRSACEVME